MAVGRRAVTSRRGRPAALPLVAALVAALAMAAGLSPAPARAGETPPFGVQLGTCDIRFRGPRATSVTITITDGTGAPKDTLTGRTGANDGVLEASCDDAVVVEGDRLVARADGTRLAAFSVPRASLSIDRVTDIVVVEGPPGLAVVLDHLACAPGLVGCSPTRVLDQRIGLLGVVFRDLTAATNVRGDDAFDLRLRTSRGIADRRVEVPHFEAVRGSANVRGSASIDRTVGVVFDRDGTVGSGEGYPNPQNASWRARMRRAGAAVELEVGMRVRATLASDARLTVPRTVLTLGPDTLAGSCFPRSPWSAEVRDGRRRVVAVSGVTDDAGAFSVDSLEGAATSGRTLTVYCGTNAGDWLQREQVIP